MKLKSNDSSLFFRAFLLNYHITIDAYNHANVDQAAVDLRGLLGNAEHAGSSLTLGGQESTQQSQYAGVHYLTPDANRRRRFA